MKAKSFTKKGFLFKTEINSLETIPLDHDKINAIIEYMNYVEGIDNIYELLNIEEINSQDISILKKYILVKESDLSEFIKNQKMIILHCFNHH